jgi:pimeloyl-ACP methyl ester carboxylesterase
MKKVPVINKFEGFAKKHIGSRDYKNASEMMRKILVETVNKDLTEYAKKITAPTLLIWGENDTEEPVERAKELEGIMSDAGLIVFPNSTHYAYLENIVQVIKIIKEFV